jgi:hypothetical protein
MMAQDPAIEQIQGYAKSALMLNNCSIKSHPQTA